MLKPLTVKTLPGYKIWIKYQDGVEGELDLSHLVGKGVFKAWLVPEAFEKVAISKSGALVWDENIEICADSLYLQLTGKEPENVFPNIKMSYLKIGRRLKILNFPIE